MRQIADWLEELGLGQYAQRFAENDITFVILPDLTDQDLVAAAAAPTVMPPAANTAERRQVTVMFSDLVGSTSLSARMDRKTCAKSFLPTRNASRRPYVVLADS